MRWKNPLNTQTLTARQREANPAKWARKDARTLIYAKVYGQCYDNKLHPSLDRGRKANFTEDSVNQIMNLWTLANFPFHIKVTLINDFNRLAEGRAYLDFAKLEAVLS